MQFFFGYDNGGKSRVVINDKKKNKVINEDNKSSSSALCSAFRVYALGGLLPYLDKDDTLTDGQQRVQANQDIVLAVLGILGGVAAVDIELLDAVNRQLLGLECDLVSLGGNLFRKLAHTLGPGGREEDNLAVSWQESVAVKRAMFNITKNWPFLFLCLPFLIISLLSPTKMILPKSKK